MAGSPGMEQWLDQQRAMLRTRLARAAWSLAASVEAPRPARVAWIERALTLAPEDEAALRRALLELERLGEPGLGLQAYDGFVSRRLTDLENSADEGRPPNAGLRLLASLTAQGMAAW